MRSVYDLQDVSSAGVGRWIKPRERVTGRMSSTSLTGADTDREDRAAVGQMTPSSSRTRCNGLGVPTQEQVRCAALDPNTSGASTLKRVRCATPDPNTSGASTLKRVRCATPDPNTSRVSTPTRTYPAESEGWDTVDGGFLVLFDPQVGRPYRHAPKKRVLSDYEFLRASAMLSSSSSSPIPVINAVV